VISRMPGPRRVLSVVAGAAVLAGPAAPSGALASVGVLAGGATETGTGVAQPRAARGATTWTQAHGWRTLL
jgi:hypothetical protein